MLAWDGMREDAERLAYRWLYMLTLNAARYNGAIAEKYDVVRRTFGKPVECGNVGVAFTYVLNGGLGWTNASFEVGRDCSGVPPLLGRFQLVIGRGDLAYVTLRRVPTECEGYALALSDSELPHCSQIRPRKG